MRIFLIASVLLVTLSACSFGVSPDTNTSTSTNSGTPIASSGTANLSDTVAKVTPNVIASGTLVTLNYTLRDGAADGKVLETTLEDVAKANNLYKTGAQYQAFQVMIGTHGVISGFEKGLLGMKKGEKKVIEVPPELGYGTGPTLREIPKYQIAPVFTMTQDKKVFGDVVTQTIEKAQLKDEMQNAKVGQVFTGANNATAKVTKVDDKTITLDIQNTDNPFYKEKLVVGTTAESADGAATFKIVSIAGTGITLEITNKQSPFYNKKFAT